ncbi:MAG: hypothetical protein HZA14_11395 [Nitrospirae bacterium]|nr:hypothetical protein [Nitrospirota bacterium]
MKLEARLMYFVTIFLNGIPESQTAEVFKQRSYRFLIAANKFQTGFDQPFLHLSALFRAMMFKKISGAISGEKNSGY